MGNKITALKKTVTLVCVIAIVVFGVWAGYPKFERFFTSTFVHPFYKYTPGNITQVVDTSKMKPAIGVPVLMYHGVMEIPDEENTTLENFVSQMEMLKREGYQTISLQDLDAFYYGDFVLPPKPIVITFDDGRKDSYYPVDKVLEKLGFKATIFVASNRMNHDDAFYLTWEDLKEMYKTGRWDVQAHGRDSHNTVLAGENNREGKFLTSRIYSPNTGLESIADFEKRVEQDYINSIQDIKSHLGYTPVYYAIPLNEYGDHFASNYEGSAEFNAKLIKKYFRLAFIEGIVGEIRPYHLYSYTLKNSNPMQVVRIEPRSLTAIEIQQVLDAEFPTEPSLSLSYKTPSSFETFLTVENGPTEIKSDGLHLKIVEPDSTTVVSAGFIYWDNYTVEARMQRLSGRSTVLLARMTDNKNFVAFGMTDNGIFLRERVNGVTKDLRPSILKDAYAKQLNTFKMLLSNDTVTVYFNNKPVFRDVKITSKKGKVGISTWSNTKSDILVKNFTVHN